jgi:hypothetical protein
MYLLRSLFTHPLFYSILARVKAFLPEITSFVTILPISIVFVFVIELLGVNKSLVFNKPFLLKSFFYFAKVCTVLSKAELNGLKKLVLGSSIFLKFFSKSFELKNKP